MIPLQDTIRARRVPLMNYIIIAVNVLIFLYQRDLDQVTLYDGIVRYGAVPARLLADPTLAQIGTLFSSMFLHGGWFHLISNMWALFIFGDNVQDCMGAGRYLLFYLTSGLVAGALHVALQATSILPVIGASGAIAGVMGAYLILFPRARIISLVPIGFLWFVHIPAVVYLGLWFLMQLAQGVFALALLDPSGMAGGVAWWSHVGGFVAGALLGKILHDRAALTCWRPDEYSPW